MKLNVKQKTNYPPIPITISLDGVPADLTGAVVLFAFGDEKGKLYKEISLTIIDPLTGQCRLDYDVDFFDVPAGDYNFDIEITSGSTIYAAPQKMSGVLSVWGNVVK